MDVIEPLLLAVVIPAAIAGVLSLAATRLLSGEGRRHAAAWGLAAAYVAGTLFTRPWGELVPSRHFHWPLYLALAAAVLGPVAAHRGLAWVERALVCLLAAVASSAMLVPTYATLQPSRWVQVPALAGYLFVLAVSLEPLARRTCPRMLTAMLALSATAGAVLTAALVSLSHGTSAAIAAAGLWGCFVAALFARDQGATAGACLTYALLAGGWAFIGASGSRPKLWGLVIIPLAPLALWCFAVGPLSKWPARGKEAAGVGLVLGIVIGAAGWAVLTLQAAE